MTNKRTYGSLPCLSVRQPWASLLVHGIKSIENRTWPCAIRGPLLIHAGRTWKEDEESAYRELLQRAIDRGEGMPTWRQDVLSLSRSFIGGLVGIVRIVSCVSRKQWDEDGLPYYNGWDEWFTGPYGLACRDARAFPRIVPYKGRQGIFRVPLKDVPYDLSDYLAA